MMMRKKLACCTRDMREISLDFDEQDRMTMYNGLESRIINSHSFDNNSGTSRGVTESFDDDYSSCSSSNNASGSFSSLWTIMKREDQSREDCRAKETPCSGRQSSDDETMKERFAKLLLGEDITGGTRGISAALALSNAISNLAASVFGELWKLEPLADEGKRKWRKEMDWLLSPTNYMVELVPTTQDDTNGQTLEIMTPKARADIHMNLPALRKLDSMLIETLDSMVSTEFWYEGEGRRMSDRRWFPSPCVPSNGLSDVERKRLLHQGKLVYQVFKAAKTINENVLVEMPIPTTIKDALPKSGKASLGEELYKVLVAEPVPAEEMINCLNLKSENAALDAVNRLEAAVVAWKRRIEEHGIRTSWSFLKDHEQTDELVYRAEVLLQQIKTKHPSLPRAFLDVTRVEYGKDVGHAILEAYSRVLANLALSILSRIGDILQEDVMSNPNSPVAMSRLVGAKIPRISDSPMLDRLRHSLVHQLNAVDAKSCDSHEAVARGGSDAEEPSEAHIGSACRGQEGG